MYHARNEYLVVLFVHRGVEGSEMGAISIHMASFVPWEMRFHDAAVRDHSLGQSEIPGPAAFRSPGSLVDKQNLSPTPNILNSYMHCNKIPM